jgi:methionyl-tRNA formyltransferase
MDGDKETGVTIMLMDTGLDTGPMLAQHAFMLTPATTATQLYTQLADLGAEWICTTLEDFAAGRCQPVPQPSEGVTLAPKLSHEEGRLDWQQSAATLESAVRALNPWPGTWVEHQGTRIKVLEAAFVAGRAADLDTLSGASQGTIIAGTVIDDQLTIACATGYLRLTKLQRPGGQALSNKDFLNGYPLPKGTKL